MVQLCMDQAVVHELCNQTHLNAYRCGLCSTPGAIDNMPTDNLLGKQEGMLTEFKTLNDYTIKRHADSSHHQKVKREMKHNKAKLVSANLQQISSNENPANFITNTHFHAGIGIYIKFQ